MRREPAGAREALERCRDARSASTPPRRWRARARAGAADVRRRAAGRPGGPAGPPFVGPAGQLLDRALAELGVDRATSLPHQRGQALQVRAARQAADPQDAGAAGGRGLPHWLESEIELVEPAALVALGATAARQLMGGVGRGDARARPVARAQRRPARADHAAPVGAAAHGAGGQGSAYAAWLDDLRQAAPDVVGAVRRDVRFAAGTTTATCGYRGRDPFTTEETLE